jgi:rubrerythrin
MAIDDRRLAELIEESTDLHVDAMRGIRDTIPVLTEIREERRNDDIDTDEIDRFNEGRRRALKTMGLGAGGIATRGLLYGSLGSLFTGLIASPARADKNLDIQILQTASSLERLAINTYNAAVSMNLGGIVDVTGTAGAVIQKFIMTTASQHDDHRRGFQAQTTALGGQPQDVPNRKFQAVVDKAVPAIKSPLDVVDLAASLEKVATDTYLVNLGLFEDSSSKALMASVMGVECQHLATLRAVKALLEGGAPELINIPIGADLAKLPAAAGSVAFPNAFEQVMDPELIAQPDTGDVK